MADRSTQPVSSASQPEGFDQIRPEGEAPNAAERLASPLSHRRREWWLQNVLPWASSAVLHIGIIVTVIVLYRAVQQFNTVKEEQLIIPEAALVENAPVGGVPNPGLGGDPNRLAAQDQVEDSPDKRVTAPGQRLNQAVSAGEGGASESILGIGAAGDFARGGKGTGTGEGGGKGGGLFGVPGGGAGTGPKVSFLGSSGNARRIVFLCDASGSMLSVFPALQRQLKQSVEGLKPTQSFAVVIFSDTPRSFSQGLVIANPENKRKAYDFVATQSAAGGTKPSSAISQAFAMAPELMFVLTDGFDQGDPAEIASLFKRLNRDKKVKVNTIRIRAAEDPDLVKLLKGIATDSGGTYKEVDKDDF